MKNELGNVKIIKDYQSQESINLFTELISRDTPLFFGRIGGSDYDLVVNYFNNKELYRKRIIYDFIPNLILKIIDKLFVQRNFYKKYVNASRSVKQFNGYFDFKNRRSNFIKYLDEMLKCYKEADFLSYGGIYLINQFKKKQFRKIDLNFLNYILDKKTVISYSFFEDIYPFLWSFKTWGENKKILVISPLSKSIEYQNNRRNFLIRNYEFPNFKLITYNTKITYNSEEDSRETLGLETDNWHEECARQKKDIEKIDFDIAFLSCGSYSMPLGDHIKKMGKKAIYIGGILNMIFNIYGDRYSYCDIVNLDYQINPIENDEISKIKGGRSSKNESINAYFGTRK